MGEVEPPEDEVIGALNDGEQGKRQVLLSAPVLRSTDALPHVVTVRMLALPHLHPLYEVWQVDEQSLAGRSPLTSSPSSTPPTPPAPSRSSARQTVPWSQPARPAPLGSLRPLQGQTE